MGGSLCPTKSALLNSNTISFGWENSQLMSSLQTCAGILTEFSFVGLMILNFRSENGGRK